MKLSEMTFAKETRRPLFACPDGIDRHADGTVSTENVICDRNPGFVKAQRQARESGVPVLIPESARPKANWSAQ